MYLHEIAIHDEHPPEDFRPPFRIDKPLPLQSDVRLTSAHIDSIATIISSAHSMLDLLLSMSINTLRTVPIYVYVRMAYSCIVLTKLYTSTRCSSSQIGPVLSRPALKIGSYLSALIARLTEAVGPMECRSPYTFLGLLMRLNDWFLTQESQNEWLESIDLFTEKSALVPITPPAEGARAPPTTMATMSAEQIYPLDPSAEEMAALGITHGFGEQSTAYVPQIPEEYGYEMGMGDNFMDPFLLFDGLDGVGGEINDWGLPADMALGDGAGGLEQDWNFLERRAVLTYARYEDAWYVWHGEGGAEWAIPHSEFLGSLYMYDITANDDLPLPDTLFPLKSSTTHSPTPLPKNQHPPTP